VQSFLRWHQPEFPAAEPVIDRKSVDLWLTALRREGKAPGSIRLWFNCVRLFTGWLADPDIAELDRDPWRTCGHRMASAVQAITRLDTWR
jgi:hypothetical protein